LSLKYGMLMDTAGAYDDLADDYHLIFENWESSIDRQAVVLSTILEKNCGITSAARILDCACGIGTQSLGLAKTGFQVNGSDFSQRSVERAQREAAKRKLDIQFSVACMLDLSAIATSSFDAVICMDNSLPHLESEQIHDALLQIRGRLRPGGTFMASIRDYDLLLRERPVIQGPIFYSDQGHRRIVHQVWDWLDDRSYTFHLYITREVEGSWQALHSTATYRGLRRDELNLALERAGFRNIHWLFPEESGFYQPIVLAEAA
jgi:glycine/sarcosine N-methyltransferase